MATPMCAPPAGVDPSACFVRDTSGKRSVWLLSRECVMIYTWMCPCLECGGIRILYNGGTIFSTIFWRIVPSLRITNSSGVILDHVGGSQYRDDSQCLFLIESNRYIPLSLSTFSYNTIIASNHISHHCSSSVTISLNSVDMECDWDFVHVFDGDSVFSPKLGAFTYVCLAGGSHW